jgi:uncharacterized membrane protein
VTDEMSNRENVIIVSFPEDSDAYEALTTLKQLDSQHQIDLAGAAVVVRDEDGHVDVKDEVEDSSYAGTVGGAFVGLLIGIIGGPLGILIGGATGVLVGSLFDVQDVDDTESALTDVSKAVRVGQTALLADVTEPSTEVIDAAMQSLGGKILRRTVEDVEAEIATADKAQRAAKREARKQLLEARKQLLEAEHEKHKEEIRAKIEELKSKLHSHKKVAAATS